MQQSYTEPLQYQPWVATHKKPEGPQRQRIDKKTGHPITDKITGQVQTYVEEDFNDLSSRTIWQKSGFVKNNFSGYNKFALGVKDFSFEDMVSASLKGHTFKRIGPNTNGTRFLFIDIDNDNGENISPEQMDILNSATVRWTPGGSGKPFRYHIFALLDHKISSPSEFEHESYKVIEPLKALIGKDIVLDNHQFSYHQVCFGVPQPQMKRIALDGTRFWTNQISSQSQYKPQEVDPNDKPRIQVSREGNPDNTRGHKLIPWTTALLANVLDGGSLEPKKLKSDNTYVNKMVHLSGIRFDCHVPYKSKIIKSRRYTMASVWILNLVPQYFRCVKEFNLDYSIEDLTHTFWHLCTEFFVDGKAWWLETGASMEAWIKKLVRDFNDMPYPQIQEEFTSQKQSSPSIKNGHIKISSLYRRKGYCEAVSRDICLHESLCKKGKTVRFTSREDLQVILNNRFISYSSFMDYVNRFGYAIQYDLDHRSTHKYQYILDTLQETESFYPYLTRNEAEKCFCKRNGIGYLSALPILGVSRGRSKAIMDTTRSAFRAFKEFERNVCNFAHIPQVDGDAGDGIELAFGICDNGVGSQQSETTTFPSLSLLSVTVQEKGDPNS